MPPVIAKKPKVCFVWGDKFNVSPSVDSAVHIGLLPMATIVGADVVYVRELDRRIHKYDIAIVNMFASYRLCQRIREMDDTIKIVATPDVVPEVLLMQHRHEFDGFIGDLLYANEIWARTESNKHFYEAWTGKPTKIMPMPIGSPAAFQQIRGYKKGGQIIANGHSWALPMEQTIAALLAFQRKKPDLPIVIAGCDKEAQQSAERFGLRAHFINYQSPQLFAILAAQAKLAIDLFPSHSLGRSEMLYAYAGTPCIGSTYTDFEGYVSVDPFDTHRAVHMLERLYEDTELYNRARRFGIQCIERNHTYDHVKETFWGMVNKLWQR